MSRSPRPPQRRGPRRPPRSPESEVVAQAGIHLSDELTRELRELARPGKGDLLVQVVAGAAAAFEDENYDEAIRLGEQGKHLALRSPSVRELLGLTYYRAGRWQEAARELSTFRRIAGSVEQNPVIADCYRALEKPDKAIELCDEVSPRAPAPLYYEANIVAAGALADLGRLDEAIARLETLDLSPDVAVEHHVRAWYVLGTLMKKKGRFSQARRWFEAVVASDPDATDAPEQLKALERA